jgi:hypothetical protein
VISDLDIWRAANLLIRQHGAAAELEAAHLQDLMLDRRDDEGRLSGSGGRSRRYALRSLANGIEPVTEPQRTALAQDGARSAHTIFCLSRASVRQSNL